MSRTVRIIIFSLICAFVLAIMPLPEWAIEFRPDWVALAIIYWVIAAPDKIGLTAAWFAGLLLDVSYGTLMGQHAVGMVLIAYVIQLQQQRLRVASLLQQAIVIFFLLLLKQLLTLWVDGMLGRAPDSWLYFMPTITSTLLWPWTYLMLKDLQGKHAANKPYQY